MTAAQGNLKLDNSSLDTLYNTIADYQATAQDALYEFYKSAYIMAASSHYRGAAADAIKAYLTAGPINVATELLDITSDLSLIANTIKQTFLQVEPSSSGRVGDVALTNAGEGAARHRQSLESYEPQINATLRDASEYIATVGLNYAGVSASYDQVDNLLSTVRNSLGEADTAALAYVNQLNERIAALSTMVANLSSTVYAGGSFSESGASDLASNDWYVKAANTTLALMLEEDPFSYEAGEVALTEDQWAAGLCQDVYVYGGYAVGALGWEASTQDGVSQASGYYSSLQADGRAQLTKYAVAEGEGKVIYGSGEVKAGISDEYFGARAKGEVGIAKAEGKVRVGPEDFGGYISGAVDFCTAEGEAAFEIEDGGEYAIGIKGSASAASADAKAGFEGFSVKADDGESTSLIGGHVGVSTGAKASFGVWAESKTVIETKYVNINAKSFSFDIGLGVGVSFDVTLPSLHFKWPW